MIESAETIIKERVTLNGDKELFIELSPELLKQLGWRDGDTLEWENFSDFATLTKKFI